MNLHTARPFQARTDAKLRYARVHLDELIAHEPLGGSDFDRAHQESFLYHLLGAPAAFLAELNIYYSASVPRESLSPGSLRNALRLQGKSSPELAELFTLDQDEYSWYAEAKAMRDWSTHQGGVLRAFHLGGPSHQHVHLRVPGTGREIADHFPRIFTGWLAQMENLISKLRESAVSRASL